MSKSTQMHIFTHYPICNINRDELGEQKSVMLNGLRRPIISSQCRKSHVRNGDTFRDEAIAAEIGKRTKKIGQLIIDHLAETMPSFPTDKATTIAKTLVGVIDKRKEEEKVSKKLSKKQQDAKDVETASAVEDDPEVIVPLETQQLIFLSVQEITNLKAAATDLANGGTKKYVIKDIMVEVGNGPMSPDVAISGRMFTKNQEYSVEAAVQVSFSIATHHVSLENDFFTGIDDLNKRRDAAHMGSRSYIGCAVFYNYVCINRDLLLKNLGGDANMAVVAMRAFAEGMMISHPTGMQTVHGSKARSDYAMIEHGSQPYTSVAAFHNPVSGADLMQESIDRLLAHRHGIDSFYEIKTNRSEFGVGLGKNINDLLDFVIL